MGFDGLNNAPKNSPETDPRHYSTIFDMQLEEMREQIRREQTLEQGPSFAVVIEPASGKMYVGDDESKMREVHQIPKEVGYDAEVTVGDTGFVDIKLKTLLDRSQNEKWIPSNHPIKEAIETALRRDFARIASVE